MLADQLHHPCVSDGYALDQHWNSYYSAQGKSRRVLSARGILSIWMSIYVRACVRVCEFQKRLTLLQCTLQSLIKALAVPFVDQCSFDRPGWIFLSKNRILSEKRQSSSAFRALMILIESEHKHTSGSSLLFSIFHLGLTAIDTFLLQHFQKQARPF